MINTTIFTVVIFILSTILLIHTVSTKRDWAPFIVLLWFVVTSFFLIFELPNLVSPDAIHTAESNKTVKPHYREYIFKKKDESRLVVKGILITKYRNLQVFRLASDKIVLIDSKTPSILKVWTCDQVELPPDPNPQTIALFRRWSKRDDRIKALLRKEIDTVIE